jgi:hypothetical protein
MTNSHELHEDISASKIHRYSVPFSKLYGVLAFRVLRGAAGGSDEQQRLDK